MKFKSKSALDCTRLSKYNDEDIETLWIELLSQSQRLLIGCVYRPPDVSLFFYKFHRILEKVWKTRRNVVISGHFNSDLLTPTGNGIKFGQYKTWTADCGPRTAVWV